MVDILCDMSTLARRIAQLLATLAPGLACGCLAPRPGPNMDADNGLVWLLPGIEGGAWSLAEATRALVDFGLASEVRVYDWWQPNPMRNLTELNENRERARQIATAIAAFHAEHPSAPIDLVGYSGGGGLAVFVAEALPPQVRLRSLILVQAAISPDFDLSNALAHVDECLANFYCPTDVFILGAGTRLFGTMDRRFVAAAGQSGIHLEAAVPDASLRGKVRQTAWTPADIATGHLGHHNGCLTYAWNARHVAPLLARPRGAESLPKAESPASPDDPASAESG